MTATPGPVRQAAIEAACRVALRMLKSGRGGTSALQFLLDTTARHFASPAVIVGEGGATALVSNSEFWKEPPPIAGEELLGDHWSVPIRTRRGASLGELRVRMMTTQHHPECENSLEAVARTAAEIMMGWDGKRDEG